MRGCLKMYRPFDGFSCEFTSITKCLNLQFIVGIRKNADSSLFYAVKLQIQRTARRTRVRHRARYCASENRTILRFIRSALFLNFPYFFHQTHPHDLSLFVPISTSSSLNFLFQIFKFLGIEKFYQGNSQPIT